MIRRALVVSGMALTVAELVGCTVKVSIHTRATPRALSRSRSVRVAP